MKSLELYSKKDIEHLTRKRTNEVKIGEDVTVLKSEKDWETELQNSGCKFVLLGIPEDVGVKAIMAVVAHIRHGSPLWIVF